MVSEMREGGEGLYIGQSVPLSLGYNIIFAQGLFCDVT